MNYGLPIVDRLQGPLGALLLLALTVAALGGAAMQGGFGLRARLGGYVETPSVTLSAPRRAMIAELGVMDGQSVRAGDVLARMDTSELEARRRLVVAERGQWQGEGRFERGAPEDRARRADVELAGVAGQISAAQAERRALQGQRASLAQLVAEGLEPATTLQELDLRIGVLQAEINGLDAQRRALSAGTGAAESPAEADPTLAVFDAQLGLIDQQLAAAVLRSPVDGRVTGVLAAPGQWVKEGEPLMRVVSARSSRVILCLSEAEDDVSEGDQVLVHPRTGGPALAGAVVDLGSAVESIAPAQAARAGRCALPTPWPSFGRAAYVELSAGADMMPGQRVVVELTHGPASAAQPDASSGAQAKGER